jgi:cardiolipin synthase
VKVLYDAIGSWSLTKQYVDTLIEAGIECHSFTPVSFARFRRKMNFRNHRKIIIIDNEVAYTGGLNIGDEYLGKGPLGHWRDTHVKLEGEAVDELQKIFLHDWCFRTEEDSQKMYEEFLRIVGIIEPKRDYSHLPALPLQVVASGASDAWHTISQGYFAMITKAENRIWITSPYLVPSSSLMTAMANAALSGVDVRIIVPNKRDHFLVFWGSRNNFAPLLRAGVRIYLYEKGFMHAKTLLMDDSLCSVGTCNMDVRSLEINFEAQLFIHDSKLAEEFELQFERDFSDSKELDLNEWEKRPLWQKIIESFGKLYSAQI